MPAITDEDVEKVEIEAEERLVLEEVTAAVVRFDEVVVGEETGDEVVELEESDEIAEETIVVAIAAESIKDEEVTDSVKMRVEVTGSVVMDEEEVETVADGGEESAIMDGTSSLWA